MPVLGTVPALADLREAVLVLLSGLRGGGPPQPGGRLVGIGALGSRVLCRSRLLAASAGAEDGQGAKSR